MTDKPWRQAFLGAAERDRPALTVELGRIHLADDPEDRTVLVVYAKALRDLARYEEAQSAFERALALTPETERGSVLRNLGLLHDYRVEPRAAERYYREAIAAEPDHASGYIFLGALLAKMGRLDEAEAMHAQGTQCSVGVVEEAWYNLGLVQRGRGDYVAALASLRRALEMDAEDQDARRALEDIEAVLFQFPAHGA